MHSGPHIKLSKKSREPLIDLLASIKGPYMPPYNCIPGSTLITFVVYIAVRLLYAYRVFNVFKQLKHPPINPQVPVLALFATTRK